MVLLVLPFSCIQIGYGRNIRTFLEVQQYVLFLLVYTCILGVLDPQSHVNSTCF